jgi:hypothetical protein
MLYPHDAPRILLFAAYRKSLEAEAVLHCEIREMGVGVVHQASPMWRTIWLEINTLIA